ncbi:transmembrane protein 272-like isoform X2 [Ascaphus truei]|uniref:transmembrane protein 272-like isoform X2 n=1 Tax=Ascaphus truei TaxID=8439 RepID=UPI003F59BC85
MAGDVAQGINEMLQVIFGLVWTALGIAMIVIGAIHINQCNIEPYIPIYLIVAGAFSFSFWVLFPLEFCLPKARKILSVLVALFCFAWFIAGSVWVFRVYNTYPGNCDRTLYLFAFSILIIHYIFIGLGIVFSLIFCFCVGRTACCRK